VASHLHDSQYLHMSELSLYVPGLASKVCKLTIAKLSMFKNGPVFLAHPVVAKIIQHTIYRLM